MTKKLAIGIAGGIVLLLGISILIWKKTARKDATELNADTPTEAVSADTVPLSEPPLTKIPVTQPITIGDYFQFMDNLVRQYDSLAPYPLSEHLLVRANSWIIDTLENTDYYRQMERGNFIFDQREMLVLRPGDTLLLPGEKTAAALLAKMRQSRLDINIPAFQLHIIEGDSVLYAFPVRVGKNQTKFLALAGNEVDLRTHTGAGEIVRISRDPLFLDPVTGEEFKFTKRDDRRTTRMPLIPWIEPSIDGIRYGQMIHPTTNPKTLGKPASNGCIGLKEADAWRVYYYAPIGTKVAIRYDLLDFTEKGDTLRYEDVYQFQRGKKKWPVQAALSPLPKMVNVCWCEP